MNIKKFKIAIILIVIFLFAQFLQVSAQEEITEISSKEFSYHGTGYELSSDGEILFNSDASKLIINQGKENEIIIEGNSGIKVSPLGKISIMESGSEFSINGNAFKNIASGDIVFDKNTGEIINADFFTNENIGSYNINENKFNVPANQRFVYNSKKEFELPEGTEILEAKNTQIKSSGIVNYKGNEIGGVLNFDENGNILVKAKTNKVTYGKNGNVLSVELGEETIINGVSIRNAGERVPDLPIFFDKNAAAASQKLEYIVIDPSKNLFAFRENTKASPGNVRIEFDKGNYLFGDIMDEKDYFFIGEGEFNPGYVEITRSKDSLPVLRTQGDIEINQDEKRFLFDYGNLILKKGTQAWPIPEDLSKISGTIPMVFESQDRLVVGLIGGNDDKNFYWTGSPFVYGSISGIPREQLGPELPDFITKSWVENSEVKQDRAETISTFANNPKFQKVYKESLTANKNLEKYIPDVKKLEKEMFSDSGRGQELEEAMNKLVLGEITNKEFGDIVKQGKDPSMTWNEVEKRIGSEKASKIKSQLKNRMELYQIIYSELSKDKELKNDLDKLKIGNEMSKFGSEKELMAINDCVNRGNSFDLCFDENYKYFGPRTIRCIIDPKYCETLTSYQFSKMRVK